MSAAFRPADPQRHLRAALGAGGHRRRRAPRPHRGARRARRRDRRPDDRRARPARAARPDRPARASARPRRQRGGDHPDRHARRRAGRPRGGVRHAEHRALDHRRGPAGLEAGLRRSSEAWCDMGLYVGGTKTNIPELAKLELGRGVCGIKIFAGSSTGDLLVEDDEHLERVMRSGRRRIAYHTEDEYRLQDRKHMFKPGDPHRRHMEWRDVECAFLGTRRLMALARATGRPAHILHVSTAEELDYLKDFRDIATCEVLVNHLTQVAPDCYDRLRGLRRDEPADPRAGGAGGGLAGDQRRHGGHGRLRPRAAFAREEAAALAGLPRRADRRADHRAGHAEPRERRAAVADAAGRPDVRRAGAGLWRGRQGAARRRLRCGLHAGGHEAAAADRGVVDRLALRLDARSPAWTSPAGRSRRSCAATW